MAHKILIADDEVEILQILQKKLEEKGYLVSTCATAKDCLEAAQKETPDLLLLDIVMPDMNGYQIASNLKDNPTTENIRILFTTGAELEPMAIIKRCQELGVFDFLLKPFTLADLLKKIEEILKK